MLDDWSLKGKYRFYLDGIKIYHADSIDILRQKLIKDSEEGLLTTELHTFEEIKKHINKRFGVEK